MKTRLWFAAILTLLVCISMPAFANDAPKSETIPIEAMVTPGLSFDASFPNFFDLDHPKLLWFEGTARVPSQAVGNTLFVQFDWLDLEGELQFSPVFELLVPPSVLQPFEFHFEIPFCPEEVSLHMSVNPGQPITVIGEFTHECIPEPSSMMLMGLSAAGVVGFVVRRRRGRSR